MLTIFLNRRRGTGSTLEEDLDKRGGGLRGHLGPFVGIPGRMWYLVGGGAGLVLSSKARVQIRAHTSNNLYFRSAFS